MNKRNIFLSMFLLAIALVVAPSCYLLRNQNILFENTVKILFRSPELTKELFSKGEALYFPIIVDSTPTLEEGKNYPELFIKNMYPGQKIFPFTDYYLNLKAGGVTKAYINFHKEVSKTRDLSSAFMCDAITGATGVDYVLITYLYSLDYVASYEGAKRQKAVLHSALFSRKDCKTLWEAQSASVYNIKPGEEKINPYLIMENAFASLVDSLPFDPVLSSMELEKKDW